MDVTDIDVWETNVFLLGVCWFGPWRGTNARLYTEAKPISDAN